MTNSVETNVSALLPAALAATDPHLQKVKGAQEKIVTLNVDIGKAFGEAIAAAHVEPLAYVAFCEAYQGPLQRHCIETLGYLTANALQVMLRTANLAAAGKSVPTKATVIKKSGKAKPLSDTAYLEQLRDAQRKAGLTVAKPGCGGDNRTPEQIAEAAAKAAAEAAAKAAAAAAAGVTVPPVAPVAPVADPVPPVAPQVKGKPAAADPVPPTIDVKKAREDAAAMLMGNAKNGDLLLQALATRRAGLIAWLQAPPKA